VQVTQGIGTDYNKEKFAITLDEADLIRLANEYGIAQEMSQLTTAQAMLLLTTEAERFVLVQAPKFGRPVEDWTDDRGAVHPGVRRQIADNREKFATALTFVTGLALEETRKRVGLSPGAS
jgi:hypothetical protein